MDSDFMNAVADGLEAGGVRVVRFEFEYMAKRREDGARRGPDRAPKLIARFEEAIALHPSGTHIPAVKLALAQSLRKEKRPAEALVYAQQVADQTTDGALQPDGWWFVALSARDLDDLDTAKEALKTLINKWPRSALTREARPVFRDVTREIWSGKQAATAVPAAPGQ